MILVMRLLPPLKQLVQTPTAAQLSLAAAERLGIACAPPPETTALGALIGHITGGHILVEEGDAAESRARSFQPMNINYGLLPPAPAIERDGSGKRIKGKDKTRAKRRAVSMRALSDIETWLGRATAPSAAAE